MEEVGDAAAASFLRLPPLQSRFLSRGANKIHICTSSGLICESYYDCPSL